MEYCQSEDRADRYRFDGPREVSPESLIFGVIRTNFFTFSYYLLLHPI